MFKKTLEIIDFVCPKCNLKLEVKIIEECDGDIKSGLLLCSNPDCNSKYPIIDGILILVPEPFEYLSSKRSFIIINSQNDLELKNYLCEILDEDEKKQGYEFGSEKWFEEYLWAHYYDIDQDRVGDTLFDNEIFRPDLSYRKIVDHIPDLNPKDNTLALDIACSFGRLTFELSRKVGFVLGLDYSYSFVKCARDLLLSKRIDYNLTREGDRKESHRIDLTDHGFNFSNMDFIVGDAQNIPVKKNSFDVVTALNIIDIIDSPTDLLGNIGRVLKNNGTFISADPYYWKKAEKETDRNRWIDMINGEPYTGDSATFLKDYLENDVNFNGKFKFKIESDIDGIYWPLRKYDRLMHVYVMHLLKCKKMENKVTKEAK